MNNYIVLNGYKSTLIKGLLISELPPISKPLQRTSVEEIDGRDGDIVTKLGYAAYDKKMTIGLFGDFNIDNIIQYFNSEGTVVFSNEPDKFYKYQIVNQIDFERLLRFRTATVTFHVQPFKFSAVDDEKILQTSLFKIDDYGETKNGTTVGVRNGIVTVSGTPSANTMFYIPIHDMALADGSQYNLKCRLVTTGNAALSVRVTQTDSSATDAESAGGQAYVLDSNRGKVWTQSGSKTYHYLYISVTTSFSGEVSFMMSTNQTSGTLSPYIVDVINRGNVVSRPKVTIYGSGDITVYLNGYSILEISNLSSSITLDGVTLNAYKGSTLLNRSVTGDLKNLKCKIGTNRFQFNGTIDRVVIEEYSRWI